FLFPSGTRFFFLLGCMRSGTTWLMEVLDTHPRVCSQGEMHPIEILDVGHLPPLLTLESVSAHAASLRHWYSMPNNAWNVPFRANDRSALAYEALHEDTIRFYFEWTMMRFLMATGRDVPDVIGDKSPTHTPHAARKINRFFKPYGPLVIHLVRDPRDAAVS